jgi:ABC-type polysaccharide/polyol phosphate transport system ATPase subunit
VTESEPRHPPLVETSGLGKRYGSITAVQDLNISVRRSEVYGFLGPNGAGKTTTLRMLFGLVKPSSGTAKVLALSAVLALLVVLTFAAGAASGYGLHSSARFGPSALAFGMSARA